MHILTGYFLGLKNDRINTILIGALNRYFTVVVFRHLIMAKFWSSIRVKCAKLSYFFLQFSSPSPR